MPSGDIVLNMIGRNNTSPAATAASASLTQMNATIDAHISKLIGETRAQAAFRAALDETSKEQARGAQISGRAQAGIQQLIFAVDDATTVYGTTGFAGAVRAASNNLTVAAAALGPWGAAIAVGISAVTQLTLAFQKNKDEVKDNTSVMEEFRKSIESVDRASKNIGRKGSFTPGQVTTEQFASVGAELKDRASVASQNYQSRYILAKNLEQQQIDFAVSRTTDKGNVIGGLSPEDAKTYQEMSREIERVKQEASDFNDEMRRAQSEYAKLQKELPKIQERELEAFQAAQDQADIRADREKIAKREAGRVATEDSLNQLRKSYSDPRTQLSGAIGETLAGYQKRLDEIGGLGVDDATKAQLRTDAEQITRNQLISLQRGQGVISSKGASTLRSGDAETFRFLNQARLGSASKSAEAKELEKLNRTANEQLTAYREAVKAMRDAEPREVLDF